MDDKLLLGLWRAMIGVPRRVWQGVVAKEARSADAGLGFMTADHHRVRDFAVRELPRAGRPLAPALIASELDLPQARVADILEELERHMTFLFRNEAGEVAWAYPVTVDQTPHRVTFSTGEQVYAA
jgi:hypothetical protein